MFCLYKTKAMHGQEQKLPNKTAFLLATNVDSWHCSLSLFLHNWAAFSGNKMKSSSMFTHRTRYT